MTTTRRVAMGIPPEVGAWLVQVAHHGLAENTHRAYQSDRRFFVAWHRVRFGIEPPLPISEAVVISFVADCLATLPADLDAQLQAHGHKLKAGPHTLTTVQRRLASLHTWHLEAGLPSACRTDSMRQLLRRSRRALRPTSPERSQPITLAVLQRLLATCETNPNGLRDRALLMIGWCGGRRRSELAALDVEDVQTDVLRIRASKTDQTGTGLIVPLPTSAHAAFMAWRALLPPTGAVFRQVRRGGRIGARLDAGGINDIIKRRVAHAGLNPREYSAHGLRSGFLTECERSGIPLPSVMAMSGHRSIDVAVGYVTATAGHQNPVITLLDQVVWS